MPRLRRFTEEQWAVQEALELDPTRRPVISRDHSIQMLYDSFRRRHFPGMPACAVGLDLRAHYFVLGTYDRRHGIVLRNNPAVISSPENLSHILLHEMTHQWITWMCLVVGDRAIQDEDSEEGHSMSFRRKMRSAMRDQFPGRDFPEAGLAKLRY